RDLTPFEGVQARLIASSKKFPAEILIGLNRENPQLHDVFRLDLRTGEMTVEVKNPGFIGWLADEDMVIRGGFAPKPNGDLDLMVRDRMLDDWRLLLTVPADDVTASDVVSFSADGRSLLAITPVDANTGRLIRIDVASGEIEVLAE